MGWLSNLFKKQNETVNNSSYAAVMNGYSPIFSQFGNNIYASDVVQQAISCIVQEMKKLKPTHIKDNGTDVISINSDIQKTILVIPQKFSFHDMDWRNPDVYKEHICKRAFLRAAYLCVGSMSDPEKSYHLEFDCQTEEQALFLQQMINEFEIEAKIVERKKYHVVYLKDGSAICDLLNIMGAHVSLMNFENFRILKEMRNSVNRKVNCETANIAKTVSAASKQIQDIMLIQEEVGFAQLPQGLREIAELRLEYPEATLQELGDLLNPPVGKSGVNHRLRKLSEIACQIRA